MIFLSQNVACLITYVEDKPGHVISITDYTLKTGFFIECADGVDGDKMFSKNVRLGRV